MGNPFTSKRWAAIRLLKILFILSFVFTSCHIALAADIRVLPFGDSITQSTESYNSYRFPLWESLVNGAYSVDFIGSMTENFNSFPPPETLPPPNASDFDVDYPFTL